MAGSEPMASVGYRVPLTRRLDLLGSCAVIISSMIGSGIYISPKAVLQETGSVGVNLIIWAVCGMITMGGALCYAELGTLVRECGGSWAYLRAGLGDAVAFAAAWKQIFVGGASAALVSVACSNAIFVNIQSMECNQLTAAKKLVGICIIWAVMYVNLHIQLVNRLLKVFVAVKILSLLMLVVCGSYWLITEGTKNLSQPFEGTTETPLALSTAFYAGLFAYSGWSNVNSVSEEIKDLKRTLPLAIVTSTLIVTALYVLVNVFYCTVLTKQQVLDSKAVAVDFLKPMLGQWAHLLSILIIVSMIGTLVSGVYARSRTLMAVARRGHMIEIISLVRVDNNAPAVSLICMGTISTVCICISNSISELLRLSGFSYWLTYGLAFSSLVILKVKKYRVGDERVFRVPLFLPILMTGVSAYLMAMAIVVRPTLSYLYVILFMLSGVLVYFVSVKTQYRSKLYEKAVVYAQVLLNVGRPELFVD